MSVEFIAKFARRQAKSGTVTLYNGAAGAALSAHKHRDVDNAVIADDGDLRRRGVDPSHTAVK